MAANDVDSFDDDADMSSSDGNQIVTMVEVLQKEQEFEEDANAVLGASDDKNCTYSKGYVKRQAIYACLTCCPGAKTDPSKRAGVCLACSLNCHENHDLIELYTKRNFRCDCGNPKFNNHPCQFTPNKSDLNYENKYNQNFSGVYCVCHRPYPDPEAIDEQEMLQCIICEDWLHTDHLEATVPYNDQYAEMVCKDCMEDNDFLHDYSDLVINVVDKIKIHLDPDLDVDITSITKESTSSCNGDLKVANGTSEIETNGSQSKLENVEETNDSENKIENVKETNDSDNKIENVEQTNDSENKIENVEKTNDHENKTGNVEETNENVPNTKDKEDIAVAEPEPKEDKDVAGTGVEETSANITNGDAEQKADTENMETDKPIIDDECKSDNLDAETKDKANEVSMPEDTSNASLETAVSDKATGASNESIASEDKNDMESTPSFGDTSCQANVTPPSSTSLADEADSAQSASVIDTAVSVIDEKGVNTENIILNEAGTSQDAQEPESNENKRKADQEASEDDVAIKKPKLDSKPCKRPRRAKIVYKGSTFWPSDLREQLCSCGECTAMYKDLAVLFLIDVDDTVNAYEALGKANEDGPSSQYERGLEALLSLDRIQQVNALTEYNKMKDKLLDFLKSFKERKEIVKEEDIKAFFAGMKPKREPDGVYFCR